MLYPYCRCLQTAGKALGLCLIALTELGLHPLFLQKESHTRDTRQAAIPQGDALAVPEL